MKKAPILLLVLSVSFMPQSVFGMVTAKGEKSQLALQKERTQKKANRPKLMDEDRFIYLRTGQRFVNDRMSYGFFKGDVAKFGTAYEVMGIAKKTFVLVNGHTIDQKANFSNPFVFNPAQRSYVWGAPYENALVAFKTVEDIHQLSALQRGWTTPVGAPLKQGTRLYTSFVIIPRGAFVHFMIGTAAPQFTQKTLSSGETEITEATSGGGVQIRWHTLPEGTIILQAPLFTGQFKGVFKNRRPIDLQRTLSQAIDDFNAADNSMIIGGEGLEKSNLYLRPELAQSVPVAAGSFDPLDFHHFLDDKLVVKSIVPLQ